MADDLESLAARVEAVEECCRTCAHWFPTSAGQASVCQDLRGPNYWHITGPNSWCRWWQQDNGSAVKKRNRAHAASKEPSK